MDLEADLQKAKSKTSLRMRYESEARVWLEGQGGLEGVRNTLGLSQRKICQLLLVDPSAWTRWCKPGSQPPPHVVRSLQWYMELQKQNPAWAEWRELFLKRQPDPQKLDLEKMIEKSLHQIQFQPQTASLDWASDVQALKEENRRLMDQVERQNTVSIGWKMVLLFNTVWIVISIIKSLF